MVVQNSSVQVVGCRLPTGRKALGALERWGAGALGLWGAGQAAGSKAGGGNIRRESLSCWAGGSLCTLARWHAGTWATLGHEAGVSGALYHIVLCTSACRGGHTPETDSMLLSWVLESVGHTHEQVHVPRRPRRPRTSRHPTGKLQCETCGRACLGKASRGNLWSSIGRGGHELLTTAFVTWLWEKLTGGLHTPPVAIALSSRFRTQCHCAHDHE